jgi:Uma2 family endonuclease
MINRHTTSRKRRWTDKELESLPEDGYKYELLDGSLIKSLGGPRHGAISTRLGMLLLKFVDRHTLGEVYASSTGFRLAPDLLLSPDISFASNARLKKILIAPDKFLQGAPDLAIEVLSPSDRLQQVHRKLDRFFEHNTRLVWWLDWTKEQIHIYTPDSVGALTRPADILSGGDVLPGFKSRLSRIF